MSPSATDEVLPGAQNGLNGHGAKHVDGVNGAANGHSAASAAPSSIPPSTSACALGDLQTEQKNANTTKIDTMSSLDICRKFRLTGGAQVLG